VLPEKFGMARNRKKNGRAESFCDVLTKKRNVCANERNISGKQEDGSKQKQPKNAKIIFELQNNSTAQSMKNFFLLEGNKPDCEKKGCGRRVGKTPKMWKSCILKYTE
jgi:hypothetical protein